MGNRLVSSLRGKAVAVAALAVAAASSASAAVIDVSDVVTGIKEYTGTTSPIVLIGAAVLLVVVAVKAIGWVRSALK
ncbi:major capsid protein [Variovorax gossypii]